MRHYKVETTLVFSEIVFNITTSLAIIALGVLFAILVYHLIRIARELKKLSHNLNDAASDAGERINDIIDRLSGLPILSYFLKKESLVSGSKVRRKLSKKQ